MDRWRGGTPSSANLLEIRTKPRPTILYVKESNAHKGFWGLTHNRIDQLRRSGLPWFAVLLRLNSTAGYVLPPDQVEAAINDGTFELSADGDYKVNEGADLSSKQRFANLEQLLSHTLEDTV